LAHPAVTCLNHSCICVCSKHTSNFRKLRQRYYRNTAHTHTHTHTNTHTHNAHTPRLPRCIQPIPGYWLGGPVGDLNSSGPTLTPLLTVGGLSWESPPNVRRGVRGPPCQLADSQLYLGPLSYCSTVVLPHKISNPNPNPSGEGGGSIGSSRPWARPISYSKDRQKVINIPKRPTRPTST